MENGKGRYAFLLRKLHSFSGIFPVGVYLLEHLFSNGFATRGPEAFDRMVSFLTGLPFLVPIEIGFIILPILFHAIYGLFITAEHQPNVGQYGYYRNWLFQFQRWTGILMVVFIFWHVYTTRIATILQGKHIDFAYMETLLDNPAVFIFMVVGLGATVFHFSNGIWNFLIKWGMTITPVSQRWSLGLCTVIGWAMFFWGVAALLAFKGLWNTAWLVASVLRTLG